MKQQSQEWFEARNGLVTGSNVGAILGGDPFRDAHDVMRSMVRQHHGAESEFKGNPATDYGNQNEKNALFEYELDNNINVTECGFYVSEKEPWLGASPDGLINHDGLIEIKCPFGLREDPTPQFKTIKEQQHYYGQVQIQLFVTGRQWCDFYQWNRFSNQVTRIEYDKRWIDKNLPKLKAFYNQYLIERELPNAEKYLNDKTRTVIDDGKDAADRYRAAKKLADEAKTAMDEAKNDLIQLADGKNSDIDGLKITLVEKDGAIAYAKVVKDLLPDADLECYRGKSSKYWMVK